MTIADLPETLGMAIGMVLLIEGLLPFLSPAMWRRFIQQMVGLSDGQIRFIGLSGMLLGTLIFWALLP
jgi:uncharacterized protein YjeT (DUF2065 family)